ncbi:MAG TPA: DUF983 domain-containing protein [Rhodopila sp.]|nr:DUF983 domain-containing protein [Rhodopila sp.]
MALPHAPLQQAPFLPTALRCRCPRCGEGALFQNLLEVRPACTRCGLDLTRVDTGDGAVVPVLLVLGALIVGLAFWVEFTFSPPLWVHAILWLVVAIPLAVVMIRFAKAALIIQQYRHRSSEMGL